MRKERGPEASSSGIARTLPTLRTVPHAPAGSKRRVGWKSPASPVFVTIDAHWTAAQVAAGS
jgi:hypothetical protein